MKINVGIIEAIRFQLNAQKLLKVQEDVLELEVTNGEWLNSVVRKLKKAETIENVSCSEINLYKN